VLFIAWALLPFALLLPVGRFVSSWAVGGVEYDEVLDHSVSAFVAHGVDGADTLLISGQGLRALLSS